MKNAIHQGRQLFIKTGRMFSRAWQQGVQKAQKHHEAVAYYGVLIAVLCALSWAACEYRDEQYIKPDEIRGQMATDESREIPVQARITPPPVLPPKYIMPVQGEILRKYSEDEPIWSESLSMWQMHSAIDIAAALGESVVAAADGKVLESYWDNLYGNTLTIDHGDGEVIRYGSLNTRNLVKVGQRVSQGEIIGAAGTCGAEGELNAHLHLEALKDERTVNFLTELYGENRNPLRD